MEFYSITYGMGYLGYLTQSQVQENKKHYFKKKSYTFPKNVFLISWNATFQPHAQKKNNPEKKFLYFLYFGMNAEQRQNQKLFSYSRMTAD